MGSSRVCRTAGTYRVGRWRALRRDALRDKCRTKWRTATWVWHASGGGGLHPETRFRGRPATLRALRGRKRRSAPAIDGRCCGCRGWKSGAAEPGCRVPQRRKPSAHALNWTSLCEAVAVPMCRVGAPRGAAAQVPRVAAELVLLLNRWDNGSALPDFTSPSEKLVCKSFTLGKLSSTSRANWLKWFRSRLTT